MPGTPTARRALPTLSGSDNVSTYPAVNLTQMTNLDNAPQYLSGTFAARGAVTGLVAGTFYYATDTTLLYEWNGTVWQTVMLAGAWTNLTLGTNISALAGYWPPAARNVGDGVQLRGAVTATASLPLGNIATLPTAQRPTSTVGATVSLSNTGAGQLQVLSNGQMFAGALGNGEGVYLDGTFFSIA